MWLKRQNILVDLSFYFLIKKGNAPAYPNESGQWHLIKMPCSEDEYLLSSKSKKRHFFLYLLIRYWPIAFECTVAYKGTLKFKSVFFYIDSLMLNGIQVFGYGRSQSKIL